MPGVSDVTKWPYEVVGAAYGVLGIAFMLVAHARARRSSGRSTAGSFAPLDERLAARRCSLSAPCSALATTSRSSLFGD